MGELPVNPRDWFEEGELDRFPFCGERAAIRTDAKVAMCIACQATWTTDGKPQRI
jgi:hypothetical protein